MKENTTRKTDIKQRGAALVTVILISILLVTASVAMLTAVGANSKNTTDVLSETKAYYAAESGLQATINVLRNTNGMTYQDAASNPSLSNYLTYNYPTSGPADRIVFGGTPASYTPNTGTAYSINVTDPDNTAASATFYTSGSFSAYSGGVLYNNGKKICIPDCPASSPPANRTEVTFNDAGNTTITFASNPPNPSIGSISIANFGTGGAISGTIQFRVDYHLTAPRAAVKTLWGSVTQASGQSPKAQFGSYSETVLGSTICAAATSSAGCSAVVWTLTPALSPVALLEKITPVLPYRLLVRSTGYGPNGATKTLEGVVQKNLFNGLASGAATSMIGAACPVGQVCFSPGTSNNVTYSGGDCASTTGCIPSFGLTDPTNLAYVIANPPHNDPTQMQPPPELLSTDTPDWLQTPAALDVLVGQLRTTAQNSGRYFLTPTSNIQNPGSTNGTGITFCEGSCKVSGSGGGILVVTGMLTNVGGFSFNGLILVTGEEGWLRTGGGNGSIVGNVVIAPYNQLTYVPPNLSATFLAPRYSITGGGASDIIGGDITATFDNTSSVSDFMLGVAEK